MATYPDYNDNYPHTEVINNVEITLDTTTSDRMAFVSGVGSSAFTFANNGSYMKAIPIVAGTYTVSSYIGASNIILSNFAKTSDFVIADALGVTDEDNTPEITPVRNATTGIWEFTIEEDLTLDKNYYITIPTAITIDYNATTIANNSTELLATSIKSLKVIKSDIATRYYFGVISADNPIAFACSIMVTSGGGSAFYADSIASNTVENYTLSLKKSVNSNNVRHVVLLTDDTDCRLVLATHVAYANDSIVQKWRTGLVAVDTSSQSTTISKGVIVSGVAEGYSDENITVVHALGGAYYASTDSDGNTVELPLTDYYCAAGIAAYMTTKLAHQGISRSEFSWISSIPGSYVDVDISEINEIGQYGIMLLRQSEEGTTPFIHHQLTTNVADGDLYREQSCVVNVQDINHKLAAVVNEYYGKYSHYTNVYSLISDELLKALKLMVLQGDSEDAIKAGPQILSYSNITVGADETYNTHVNASVDIEISTITNVIKLTINTYLGV